MAEYSRAIKTALRLITKKGMPVVWSKLIPGADISPGRPGPATPVYFPTVAVFLPANLQTMRTMQELFGPDAPVGREMVLLPAFGAEPDLNDLLYRGATNPPTTAGMKPFHIDTLAPAGDAVLHTVWLTR